MAGEKRRLSDIRPTDWKRIKPELGWGADLVSTEVNAAIAYFEAIEVAAMSGSTQTIEAPEVAEETLGKTWIYAHGQYLLKRAFMDTNNPVFCWLAWMYARDAGRVPPDYAWDYLDRCAASVSKATRSRRTGGKGVSDLQLMRAFGFSRGRGPSTTTRAATALRDQQVFSVLCERLLDGVVDGVVDNETAFIDVSEALKFRKNRPGDALSEETIRNRYYKMRRARAGKRRAVSK